MAQTLGKMNMSPKLRKMTFLHKIGPFFPKFPFPAKSSFLKKNLTHNKNQLHTLAQPTPMQKIPIIFSCCYKPPRIGPHEVRNGREAAVPEKETKILKEGARGDRGSPDQNESPIPELSNAL